MLRKGSKSGKEDRMILNIPVFDQIEGTPTDTLQEVRSRQTKISECSGYMDMPKRKLVDKILKQEKVIKNYEKRLKNKVVEDDEIRVIDKKIAKRVNQEFNFVDKKGNEIKLNKTDIPCWWCSRVFSDYPSFIVDRYVCGKYQVFGCFCNFSCAMAYNMKTIKDFRTSFRESLTNNLCCKLFGDVSIKPAPNKELLSWNGGSMSDDEYDQDAKRVNKRYACRLPLLDYKNLDFTYHNF